MLSRDHPLTYQEIKNCSGSACGISLNQPAACGDCRSQKAVSLTVGWKKMSKGGTLIIYTRKNKPHKKTTNEKTQNRKTHSSLKKPAFDLLIKQKLTRPTLSIVAAISFQ
jgi:hypothetical protein